MTSRKMGDLPRVEALVIDADTVRFSGDEFRRVRKCRNMYPQDGILPSYPETMFECELCGCTVEDHESYAINMKYGSWNYCPNCGA